jgi:UDP-glucose 4-epimerase
MKIAVVGGAGYIGSHVCKALLAAGHRVLVYDNLSSGLQQNLLEGCEFQRGDVLEQRLLCETLSRFGAQAAIHLAAFKAAGESMTAPAKYSQNNIAGSISLVNACLECGIKRLVFSSTAAVYGAPQYLPINEEHPTVPENYYGFTKLEIERILQWQDRLAGLRFAALRYFNAAGYDIEGQLHGLERNPANLLPVVMETAVGMRPSMQVFGDDYATRDGTCIRDYIHVSDLASAHVKALAYIEAEDRSLTVNLGSGRGITVLEMISEAERITGKPLLWTMAPRRQGDPAELYAIAAKAKELLGWEAVHSDVETLLRTTYAAYRANAPAAN